MYHFDTFIFYIELIKITFIVLIYFLLSKFNALWNRNLKKSMEINILAWTLLY